MYTQVMGEVTVGGVFLRLFIAQPTWVLRKPKEFLIALLEMFGQLTQSSNPDVRRNSIHSHGSLISLPSPLPSSHPPLSSPLLLSPLPSRPLPSLQGEVLETVTTACVCLFTHQPTLADQVPPLGHIPRILGRMKATNDIIPRSCTMVIHVLADSDVSSNSQ